MLRNYLAFIFFSSLLVGCGSEESRPAIAPGHRFAMRLATIEPMEEGWVETKTRQGELVYMAPVDLVTSKDVESVHRSVDERGRNSLNLRVSHYAGKELYKATRNEGRYIVVLVNDDPILALPVGSQMRRDLQITGEFTSDELGNLYNLLTGYEGPR